MKKSVKIWLITAVALILVGLLFFGGAMTMLNWDFSRLSTVKYETVTHEIQNTFSDVLIMTHYSDVTFVPSDDEKCKVVCLETEDQTHTVEVKDGVLRIESHKNKTTLFNKIGINIKSPKITVYIPGGEYGKLSITCSAGDVDVPGEFSFESIDISGATADTKISASAKEYVKIKVTTGDVNANDLSARSVEIEVSTGNVRAKNINCTEDISISCGTGDVNLSSVECKNMTSKGTTGDIVLDDVDVSGALLIKRGNGDVSFKNIDAAEIDIKTTTGDVNGTLRSGKTFVVNSTTGDISVPPSEVGGICKVTTTTGDIKIKIK